MGRLLLLVALAATINPVVAQQKIVAKPSVDYLAMWFVMEFDVAPENAVVLADIVRWSWEFDSAQNSKKFSNSIHNQMANAAMSGMSQ